MPEPAPADRAVGLAALQSGAARGVVRPAPGPAPRSAPVIGSAEGSDWVRAAKACTDFLSAADSLTEASPAPPSTAAWASRSSTTSHCSPWFQGPLASPSPWDML